MDVTLLAHLHGYGGAEKSIVLLANQLTKRGHNVTLVTVTANNNKYTIDENVSVCFIPDKGRSKAAVLLHRFIALNKFFKTHSCDLAISFWFQIGLFAMIISKFEGFKVIYSERGDPGDIEYSGFTGVIRNLLFPGFDGFVFQTKGARDFFPDKIRNKSCVIHNAIMIDEKIINCPVKKENYIVSMGRLHRQKNFQLLIDAFNLIQSEFIDYKLIIYGDGELRDSLQKRIDTYNLTKRVLLAGNTNEPYKKMQEAKIFVLSSDFEGMPNVLMEAMALGLPVISTDCSPGGAAELIENNVNGVLVPCNNVELLASAIRKVINDPSKAIGYGNSAKEIVKTHSLKTIYDAWDRYIKEIVK